MTSIHARGEEGRREGQTEMKRADVSLGGERERKREENKTRSDHAASAKEGKAIFWAERQRQLSL